MLLFWWVSDCPASTAIHLTSTLCFFFQCYGAEHDRKLNIPNEDDHVLSAREFVAWYNGLPDVDSNRRHERIATKLANCRSVSIIGQGNVAIDVARILLSPVDELQRTDITQQALHALRASRVQEVNVIGRRGPLQAAFTIKELREMLKLPNVITRWRPSDFDGIDEAFVAKLPRPKKRITELMMNSLKGPSQTNSNVRIFSPIFFRSPDAVDGNQLRLLVNELTSAETALATDRTELLSSDMVLRSIGYKSINVVGDELNFDSRRGLVPTVRGNVLRNGVNAAELPQNIEDAVQFSKFFECGLYASGWLASGPIGVILTTMSNSYLVASKVCEDFQKGRLNEQNLPKSGIDYSRFNNVVTWDKWLKIDKAECEIGQKYGKPREKFLAVNNMLEVAHR